MELVAQDSPLFSGSAAENVRFGRDGANDLEVAAAVEFVDVRAVLADRGFMTPWQGRQVYDLSSFVNLVAEGHIIETGDLVAADELLAQIGTVPGLATAGSGSTGRHCARGVSRSRSSSALDSSRAPPSSSSPNADTGILAVSAAPAGING